MELKKSESLKNLIRSFSAECQDGAKYQYLADQATNQKLSEVATILKQLATNEMAHAKIFYDYISKKIPGGVDNVCIEASYPLQSGNLEEMLLIESKNEERQYELIYQNFAKTAKDEGFKDLSIKYEEIAKVEKYHSIILNKLSKMLKEGTLYSSEIEKLWKCLNCGFEDKLNKVWDKCPLCEKDYGFVKITL